ncbi:MipA/OmpV family protein [Exilibacterium tricleocarpae]|uniref:MipA/OmpV family protein n=1 Tax=Exilibacterium tricleocarpae TaxID=2591008 RepID=A0A545TAF5_9GAMM|nr:MipA/OmpV family protein [Exilibacterium tricleocarpae]TQV74187.1 MipA/OmpV family protein [Exilibacterium tricleocarpae]
MRSTAKYLALLSSAGLLCFAPVAAVGAEDTVPPVATAEDDDHGWSLGLAVINSDSTYIDYDERFPVLPMIEYTSENFTFFPLGISYRLFTTETKDPKSKPVKNAESDWALTLHTRLNFGFGERDEDESEIFADMEEREYGSTAGLSLEVGTPIGAFEFTADTDITNASEGSTATLSYGFPIYFTQKLAVLGSLGLEYQDRDYTDYYYGVRETEVRADRLAYRADAATNSFLGYALFYQLSTKWSLIHSARYLKLHDEIVDSTLTTDEDNQLEAILGVRYSF